MGGGGGTGDDLWIRGEEGDWRVDFNRMDKTFILTQNLGLFYT